MARIHENQKKNEAKAVREVAPVAEQPVVATEVKPVPVEAPVAPAPQVAKDPKMEYGNEDGTSIIFIEQSVSEFAAATGRGHTTNDKVPEFRKLHAAVRHLMGLRGAAFRAAFYKFVGIVTKNETGAFNHENRFKHLELIGSEAERKAFTTFLDLLVRFAGDKNKATFRERVNVNRLLDLIDPELHNDINSVFPS